MIQLLDQLNTTRQLLRLEMDMLEANLTATRDGVNRTFQMPGCQGCASLQGELGKLTLDTSFSVSAARRRLPHLPRLHHSAPKTLVTPMANPVKGFAYVLRPRSVTKLGEMLG